MKFPILNIDSKATRLAIFIALEFFGVLLGIAFGIALIAISRVSTDSLNGIRISQICNQLFIFVLPPLFYAALTRPHPMKSLGFKKMPVYALLGILVMFTILPFNSYLQSWNEQLSFPESMKALEEILRALQEQATAITEKMVSVNGIRGLVVNLIMMAGLAALGEEPLFRAMLQPWLIRITKSPHIGIIITAIIFSVTHLEIDGFLSRAVLGMALGYVFFYLFPIQYRLLKMPMR